MSLVLLFIIAVSIIYVIKSKYRLFLTGCRIAGPLALPLLGNVQMISKLKPEYLFLIITENRVKYGETFRLWLGPQLWVFLHSPKETRDALNDSSLKRADTFQQLNVLIGNGLLISEGKHWEQHHRALAPAFQPNVLNNFLPNINDHAELLVEKIHGHQMESLEVSEYLFPCILDTIIDTSMGKKLNSQQDPDGTYAQAFHNTSELLFKRMVNPLLAADIIFKQTEMYHRLQKSLNIIHNLMDTVIEERAAYLANQFQNEVMITEKHQPRTFLDILLTTKINENSLTNQEIRDEVNTFVFAGVDTTTAAMSFVLYALAKHPMEQQRIFEEIQATLNKRKPNDYSDLTVNELNGLKYLDMFIKETLRFYTIVPMTGRQTTQTTKIGDIKYCAGVTIWINMYGLAHDDELFEDANKFKPLRFSTENGARDIPPFSYLPFSGGPHVCIGRKYALLIMKTLTVKLVRNFHIHLNDPNEKLILMAQMVLKSLNGVNLRFKLRE